MSDRRSFLVTSLGALSAAALGGCASIQTVPVSPQAGRVRLAVRNHPNLARPGGSLKILPEGYPTFLLVLVLADGGYAVVSPICTHQGCTVGVEGAYLVCPCHGSTYQRDGEVIKGPAPEALRRFPARLDAGVLEIDLEDHS